MHNTNWKVMHAPTKNKETWLRVISNNYNTFYNTWFAKHEQVFVPKSTTLQLWAKCYDSLCHVTASFLPLLFSHTFSQPPQIFQKFLPCPSAVHVDSVSANFFFLCGAISTKDAKDSERDAYCRYFWGANPGTEGRVGCWSLEQPFNRLGRLLSRHTEWNFG